MALFSSDELRTLERKTEVVGVVEHSIPLSDFKLDDCIEWIKEKNLKKVCLQFPDDLLNYSPDIVFTLEINTDCQYFIIGDTSYGSCCVDEVTAEHVLAEGVIHFGHACLSPTKRLPVLYIFNDKEMDIPIFLDEFEKTFQNPEVRLILFFDVNYLHAISPIQKGIQKYNKIVITKPAFDRTDEEKFCLGRTYTLLDETPVTDYEVLFIGRDGRSFTNLVLEFGGSTVVYRYDPQHAEEGICQFDGNNSKFLMKRLHLVERVKDSSTLGILVGTLSVAHYMEAVERVKFLAKLCGKKTYIISVGRPNVAKLANFPEVDVFVLISCPENCLLDWKEFYKPVVSLHEIELACNPNRVWTPQYTTDFRRLLLDGDCHVEVKDNANTDASDVSLITGKLRNLKSDDNVKLENTETSLSNRPDLSMISTGGRFLAGRTWQGLDPQLGQTPVELASEGRSGIPIHYDDEGK